MIENIKTTEVIEISLEDLEELVHKAVEAGRNAERKETLEMGTQIGIVTAMELMKKEKEERRKSRFDRRLRNTKLLLKEYRTLSIHKNEAVDSNLNPIDILDELDGFEFDEDLYIESIKRSKDRTAIIVRHINKMIEIFRYMCERSKRPEDERRHKVIQGIFISDDEKTPDELSSELNINQRTVYKDIDEAVKTLSALFFGIDGLKIY